MKKYTKKNLKIIIAFIIGMAISSMCVYAANIVFQSDQVNFDNTNAGITLNNQSVDNVQDALDAINTKVSSDLSTCNTNYNTCSSSLQTAQSNYSTCNSSLTTCQDSLTNVTIYRDEICPGCVYRYSTTEKYNSNASGANGTNNKLSSSEYTTDYTTLNSNYFLGHVIDGSGYILASYACGINNGTFFCLRGVDSNQSSLTYKPFYQEGVNRMNKAFPGCNATTSSSYGSCRDEVAAYVRSHGTIDVTDDGGYCSVFDDGSSFCY